MKTLKITDRQLQHMRIAIENEVHRWDSAKRNPENENLLDMINDNRNEVYQILKYLNTL